MRRWAGQQGQDFVANHQTPGIDFATFHSWVDNWLDDDITFQTNWIRQHAADAAAIGKPVRRRFSNLKFQIWMKFEPEGRQERLFVQCEVPWGDGLRCIVYAAARL